MSGVGTGIAIAAGVGAAGSVAAGAIGSSAAGNAASKQESAANYAADVQKQEADNALAFEKQQWTTDQANLAPWLSAGKSGLAQLQALLGLGGNVGSASYGSLLNPFQAPTLSQAENDPGYKFDLSQSLEALQNSAAAKGNLLSGSTQEALSKFAQNFAENDYTNVYNRAFNTFETNQTNTYNRLAALAGLGQTTATTLGNQGNSIAGTVANIDLTTGRNIGTDVQNAAAAEASGYVGGANAWSSALTGGTSNLMNLILLSQMGRNGTGGGNPYGAYNSSGTDWMA